MDLIDQSLTFLAGLSANQLAVGIAITAAIVSIVIDWRLSMFGVLVQFLFVSLLLNTELPGGLGMIKLLVGAIACMMLYWTARKVEQALDAVPDGRAWFMANRIIYPMGLPFRFLALLFTTLVLLPLPERLGFALFPPTFLIPALWLLAMGLLAIILTRDPLKTGLGLLTFQNGFELLYSLWEPELMITGLLAVGTIIVGLVASYLAIARHLPLIEARLLMAKTIDPHSPEALATAVAALGEVLALPVGSMDSDLTQEEFKA